MKDRVGFDCSGDPPDSASELRSDVSSAWERYRSGFSKGNSLFDFARRGELSALRSQTLFPERMEETDSRGYTVLMLAAYHGHEETVRFLISRGADVNSTDVGGNSILMGAAFKGYYNIVKLLLENGADPDYENPKGQTAYQFSVMFGRTGVSELLRNSAKRNRGRIVAFLENWFLYAVQNAFKGVRQ
ncbi:ankyrin repeat domain-containing protein [Leptospira ellisii]|uniref:Ankyrin repeat domain-containing protein n=1 Tax=Leptospira ellisii TaxID=2023197 RepID=A0A2N0BJ99_9LEPT|nr:ankyrin repeat domain-containing protein [Leptospira ellisii]MDV6234829.1 ankyrin repeat domain-containing protein [Leptospira ellisii]PJZ92277.1 hypothetical protein CH379_14025 [Leptospira ellisii]PKA04082.1 hypothetical protein CH375_13100 [Leptospira ellisii]